MMHLHAIPFKSVGPFIFNDNINNYTGRELGIEPGFDNTDWDTYRIEKYDLVVYTENELITSIACYKECIFKDKNLIAMKIMDLVSLSGTFPNLNQTDTIYINDENRPHIIYEFEALGMQVWAKDGIIDTVCCSGELVDILD